ncbi:TIGR04552 family protein [Pseudenhygromyxa sp. WMMC2535]|uniref:TIGR04552 family protein n=1 Tax=Pseudenhygromyxa sp. WMMC2535 TaxID=2712867 RepID=UPI00155616ED|nr:TIGR04552 family protein [Pseudenhygromyxa sp. WMMC2535]NVB36623.1 TIGR04552 family protein [Pseudenhygromyxa sp. WMMC2535]
MTEPQDNAPDSSSTTRLGSAFRVSEILRHEAQADDFIGSFSLQDANELRLLLRGESVVDWHRLDYDSEEDSRRMLALNSLDWDDDRDRERIEFLRGSATDYLREVLKLHVDEVVASAAPFVQLPLMASGKLGTRKQQRNACTLLKVMHILYHLDARELRTRLALSDSDLFSSVENSVLQVFDQLRNMGAPVVEFQWSRKTRDSLLTKMLVKRETSAARVFDRLRFRLIVKRREDILPTLRIMLRKLIPYNYVVPGQTVNTLVETSRLDRIGPSPLVSSEGRNADQNEFSGANFRVINFIADLPVRVEDLVDPSRLDPERGNVVFVLVEFQILDLETAKTNEQGESSHDAYKTRQHARVRERMLRAPSESKAKNGKPAEPTEPAPSVRDDVLGRVPQIDDPAVD